MVMKRSTIRSTRRVLEGEVRERSMTAVPDLEVTRDRPT
jgi:hypothetical protein